MVVSFTVAVPLSFGWSLLVESVRRAKLIGHGTHSDSRAAHAPTRSSETQTDFMSLAFGDGLVPRPSFLVPRHSSLVTRRRVAHVSRVC